MYTKDELNEIDRRSVEQRKAVIGAGIGPVPSLNQAPEILTVEQAREKQWADRLNEAALRSPEHFSSIKAAVEYEKEQFRLQQAEIRARHAATPSLDREKVVRETTEAFHKLYPPKP
jgi:hypothetical protein